MDLIEEVGQDIQSFVQNARIEISDMHEWFNGLLQGKQSTTAATTPAITMPSGTPVEQSNSLLLTIANQLSEQNAVMQGILNALAPSDLSMAKSYNGTLPAAYTQSQAFFQFNRPRYHFLPLNDSSLNSMYMSFDGVTDFLEIKVGEYLPFNFFPGFTQIYFRCADIAATVRLTIW